MFGCAARLLTFLFPLLCKAHKLIKESGSKVMLRVGNKETDRAPGSRGKAKGLASFLAVVPRI